MAVETIVASMAIIAMAAMIDPRMSGRRRVGEASIKTIHGLIAVGLSVTGGRQRETLDGPWG
ncbi:hypothetical protein GCM10011335_26990 [Aureimonas glaciei]|uniref:Uncharacterized protein n=1 Tax=Aureimonas glaciei TaxID=1776957 RepID=A0A916XZ87_9HYPH|nr:hypothetical protein GCM10011335_26990 [Aureimonas glaciei]